MSWGSLNDQDRRDLLAWFNVVEPDYEDRRRLAKLFEAGRFEAWDCPECGARVYKGDPENWAHFQGVLQVDYASYPGRHEKYRLNYLLRMCDTCRCFDCERQERHRR